MFEPRGSENRRRRNEHRTDGVPRAAEPDEGNVRVESERNWVHGVPRLREPPELYASRHDPVPALPLLCGVQQGVDIGDDPDEQGRARDGIGTGRFLRLFAACDGDVRRYGQDAHRRQVRELQRQLLRRL